MTPVSMTKGGGGVLCLRGASRRLGLGSGQWLVVAVLDGVSPSGEMVCYAVVLRRRWVTSFVTGRKLCPTLTVAGDVDALSADFFPEGVVVVI
jgi:hypothetical protein